MYIVLIIFIAVLISVFTTVQFVFHDMFYSYIRLIARSFVDTQSVHSKSLVQSESFVQSEQNKY